MKILSGKEPAAALLEETRQLASKCKTKPNLAIILVEGFEPSERYVRNKSSDAEKAGCTASVLRLPSNTTEEEICNLVVKCNMDDNIHGVIVQLPLPKGINEQKILDTITPAKDVDGLTNRNKHALYSRDREPLFHPCTPEGIIYLLDYYKIPLLGADACVIGRSELVGKPIAQMLLDRNASVQICHSKSSQITMEQRMRAHEIYILAAGVPRMVKRAFLADLKGGPVVIDVGINFVDGKLCGDFDTRHLSENDPIMYTPVPGGVGLMTRAVLMYHVAQACKSLES